MWTTPVKALEPAPGLPTELPAEVTGEPKPRAARASSAPRRRPSSASRPRRRRARSFSSDDSGDEASEEDEEEDSGADDEPEADPAEVPLLARQRFALAPPDVPPQQAPRKRTGGARKAVRHVTHAEDRPPPAPKPAPPPRCVAREAAAAMVHRSRAPRCVAPRACGAPADGKAAQTLLCFIAAVSAAFSAPAALRWTKTSTRCTSCATPTAPPRSRPWCVRMHRGSPVGHLTDRHRHAERRASTSTAPATSATPRSRAWPRRRCTTARAAVRCGALRRVAKAASR